jgi:hypothetical protein
VLFPALHGNCRRLQQSTDCFSSTAKAGVSPTRSTAPLSLAGAIGSCAGATLFPPAMNEASRGQPSTFNRAYWIEYSSRQLRDFTRPAIQADLKKPNGAITLTWGVHGHAFDQNHGRAQPVTLCVAMPHGDADVKLKASHIEFRIEFVRQI